MKLRSKDAYGDVTSPRGDAKMKKRGAKNEFPDPASLPRGEITLEVLWEGSAKVIGTVTVDANATLVEINDIFEEKYRQSQLFHYLCRGKGVHYEHWDILAAKYFFPKLYIRGGTVNTPTIVMGAVADGKEKNEEDVVPQDNNPYLKSLRKAKKVPVVVVAEEPEVVFLKPLIAPMIADVSSAGGSSPIVVKRFVPPAKKAPTQAKVSITAAAPKVKENTPEEVSATLAQRAKLIFGAIS